VFLEPLSDLNAPLSLFDSFFASSCIGSLAGWPTDSAVGHSIPIMRRRNAATNTFIILLLETKAEKGAS
jgi:hypothetical protein